MISLLKILNEQMLENNSRRIYVDLDGVLVDFDKKVYSMTGGINKDRYVKLHGIDSLWREINRFGSEWWSTLEWKPDGKILWEYLKKYNPIILTSGSVRNTGDIAKKGKEEWCRINLGETVPVIVVNSSSDKQKYATPSSILVDDLNDNIIEWRKKFGIGILHTDTKSTITKLAKIL